MTVKQSTIQTKMAAGYVESSAEPAALSNFVDKKDVFAVHLTGFGKTFTRTQHYVTHFVDDQL